MFSGGYWEVKMVSLSKVRNMSMPQTGHNVEKPNIFIVIYSEEVWGNIKD